MSSSALRRRRFVGRTVGAVTAGTLGYAAYLYKTDEGVRRACKAYAALVPVVLHYRAAEAYHHYVAPLDADAWQALDDQYAAPTVAKLAALQGMYCKYGQTAAGMTNTLGPTWIKHLRTLENKVPPRPVQVVYETIQQETGKAVEETFSYFDPIPLGSASIGQVHRARLRGNKHATDDVCVKVQYPNAKQLFTTDMHAIRLFCQVLAPEHLVTLGALEKQNVTELDYSQEARNLDVIAANMQRHGFMPSQVVVPRPVAHLTTPRMLVMEYVPGEKLSDGINAFVDAYAAVRGTTRQALEQAARRRIETKGIPPKYAGPGVFTMDLYRRYLRFQDAVVNSGIWMYNAFLSSDQKVSYCRSVPPPNIPRIIDLLMRVHGCQLLQDGVFQSDPHGGNFLLMPDGRIGLIDYGSTKYWTRNERLSACLLYAAIYRQDAEKLFTMCEMGGYKSKYGRKDVLYQLIQFGYNDWSRDVTGNKNLQQFIDHLKRQDPWEETPDNFVMAQFMSIRLRSLALGMNHPVKCSDWWGPLAEETLKTEGLPYESWDYEQMLQHKPQLNMQRHKFA